MSNPNSATHTSWTHTHDLRSYRNHHPDTAVVPPCRRGALPWHRAAAPTSPAAAPLSRLRTSLLPILAPPSSTSSSISPFVVAGSELTLSRLVSPPSTTTVREVIAWPPSASNRRYSHRVTEPRASSVVGLSLGVDANSAKGLGSGGGIVASSPRDRRY